MPARQNLAHRQHDVRMRLLAAVPRLRPMHVQVRHHAARHELLTDKVLRQPDRLGASKLAWQQNFDIPRKLRVLPLLAGCDLVPQHAAVQPALGRAVRQHDLPMHDARLGGVVVVAVELVVVQPLAGSVGGRRDDDAPAGAADHLGREMVDSHGGGSGSRRGRKPSLSSRMSTTTYKRTFT